MVNHPNSPEFHHLLQQGLEIFEHISPEASSQDNPRYDTSTRRDPLHPITPDTSPTKSSGFAEHASSVNAFAATSTSKATSKGTSIPILNFDQIPENLAEEDCVGLSDSSPARPTPRHQLSDEERHLAAELIKCLSVPALTILAPLPQTQWDLFFSTLKANNEAFHITPSKFDFSNKFLLEIGEPQRLVTTFHMEILMYMLAERHRELLHREQLAFTTPFLASGIQEIWKRSV
ncbi:hypothetical protein Bca52824_011265 [Brassica carinata]|uniref:Uncharacterized protein n=1 Tax=Brassica carinata TaxID=52824 RepID=A0A8X8BBI0_BRACI|nr:hypothetical protein Bca52824_011265 [Brassica carinata]